MYNDNVGVVSVCGKDEFRVDDIEYDGYLVINDLVIKDVVNWKDDYINDNVSVIDVKVVMEEDNVIATWLFVTYKEETKDVIMKTTLGKKGKMHQDGGMFN